MEAVVQSSAFIAGVFGIIGALLSGIGFLIKWGLTERKARREEEARSKANRLKEMTEAEKVAKENQDKIINHLELITLSLKQLNNNQDILKQASFLSLESVDLQLRELHEKGILNGESKVQRKKIADFYKKCANDAVFTELEIKSDYLNTKSKTKSKKIS